MSCNLCGGDIVVNHWHEFPVCTRCHDAILNTDEDTLARVYRMLPEDATRKDIWRLHDAFRRMRHTRVATFG